MKTFLNGMMSALCLMSLYQDLLGPAQGAPKHITIPLAAITLTVLIIWLFKEDRKEI